MVGFRYQTGAKSVLATISQFGAHTCTSAVLKADVGEEGGGGDGTPYIVRCW
jgi:hypothetical protein